MEKTHSLKFKAVCLTEEKGKSVYKDVDFDLQNLKPSDVVIKMQYAAIGPFDLNILNKNYRQQKDYISFGFEGVGTITHVGKDVESKHVGQKVSFMTIDSDVRAYSEYSVVPFSNVHLLDEKTSSNKESLKQASYLYGNPFTANGFYLDVLLKENHKSIIMDTANSSLGKMISKLCLKHSIQLIAIVRSDDAVSTMNKISENIIALSSNDKEFAEKLKAAVEKTNPSIYVTFQGGNLPSRVFEAMGRKAKMAVLGNINHEPFDGFSTAPFIFQEKSIVGYTVMDYFKKLQNTGKLSEVAVEVLGDKCYETEYSNTDVNEFKLSEFEKGVEFYNKNYSKGKILFIPDN